MLWLMCWLLHIKRTLPSLAFFQYCHPWCQVHTHVQKQITGFDRLPPMWIQQDQLNVTKIAAGSTSEFYNKSQVLFWSCLAWKSFTSVLYSFEPTTKRCWPLPSRGVAAKGPSQPWHYTLAACPGAGACQAAVVAPVAGLDTLVKRE